MAQLININSTEFRRCNLAAIQSGTWASIVPAADEIILISTTNELTDGGSGNCDAYIVGDGETTAAYLEVKNIEDRIYEVVGINKYDGNGTPNGQYMDNCIVPINDPSQTKIMLSTKGNLASYFLNTKFILADGTETPVTHSAQGYSPDLSRMGRVYNIPNDARFFSFRYRHTYSGGTLVSEPMATYGETYYSAYMPYERFFALKNPYTLPYTDAAMMPVYVSPTGNDTDGDGSIENPFFSLDKATAQSKRVIMRGGLYNYDTISNAANTLSGRYGKVEIEAYPNEEPIIFKGFKKATSATLMSGSTKVYVVQTADPNAKWIYQWGIADEATRIADADRTPYHRDRVYRSPLLTAIRLTYSVESIEASDDYLYFFDNSTGKLYFSCPVAPSVTNFVFQGYTDSFQALNGLEIHLKGITFVGCGCTIIDAQNSTIEDCRVYAARTTGAFRIRNSVNLRLERCECGFNDAGAGSDGGDGFNVHVDEGQKAVVSLVDCWAHDANNDGFSDHEDAFTIIEGGLFEYNTRGGVGAGITPAYGANDVIRNVIIQRNTRGIQFSALQDSEKNGVVIFDSIVRNNSERGCSLLGNAQMTLMNCAVYGNLQGIIGSDIAHIQSIKTSSFNNTNPDQYVDVLG